MVIEEPACWWAREKESGAIALDIGVMLRAGRQGERIVLRTGRGKYGVAETVGEKRRATKTAVAFVILRMA